MEKQKLCIKILQELILLRGVLCTTQKLYIACSTAIFNAWDEGLGTFIDNKFFAPVLSKHALLFKNNSSTFASLPLKIKSSILITLFSSELMTGTIESSNATPS
ncbi:MAG: hypothetical protein NTX47_01835, partial [Candidatus Omnitrophica bacterium]|nr:hypothetical protein [Candidatus Omnitrophota bacterium]